jgi:hypothetical protein
MVKVFSFSLFGNQDKYCKGILKNIEQINRFFPEFEIWVYLGENVPIDTLSKLTHNKTVRCINTNVSGNETKFYRFFAIDNLLVEVAIIRDADSRVYERDIACIEDFLNSEKKFHIIRDHKNHTHKIMAGMWGIKKGLLDSIKIYDLYTYWKEHRTCSEFWDDTNILCELLYPLIRPSLLVHDNYNTIESEIMPFRKDDINGKHFVGQVYEYDETGQEYPKF